MNYLFRIKRNHTLYKWIVVGCIALMIPISCAIINYFINKNLVERKINQVNNFMLENIRHNIDGNLNNILEKTRYYMLDRNFLLCTMNVGDEKRFLNLTLKCYQSMKLSEGADPNTELMLYLPEKEYLLSSRTANQIQYIYSSLLSRGKLSLSLEAWKKELTGNDKGGFMISSNMGYRNCGKESLVYVTPVQYSNSKKAGFFITSISTDFLEQLMQRETNMGNTVLILDKDNRVIGQYGADLILRDMTLEIGSDNENLDFQIQGEEYVGSFTNSAVADWKYVVCIPKRVFMKEVTLNRNLNAIIVLIGAIIGMAAVIILQYRNYRPVRRLVNTLPELNSNQEDEFVLVEKNLRKLYKDNQSMQDSIESRREYDRELGLLSAIKGSNNFFKKLGTEELLGKNYQSQSFAFVTIRLSEDDGSPVLGESMERSLLCFLIDNVTMDILGNNYSYIKTLDDCVLVYLFLINREGLEEWENVSMEKFQWLNEFFQNRLGSDLSITLGRSFDDFEYVESAYSEISESNEQRYYTEPDGVVRAASVSSVDISSSSRLAYFTRRFRKAVSEADLAAGQELGGELFQELESFEKPFHTVLFYVLTIVNHIMMGSSNLAKSESVREESLETVLAQVRMAESSTALQKSFYHFLHLICRGVDMDNKDSKRFSENIMKYVNEHYADSNVNISAIAEEMGITPRYMSRIFKEQTGMNLLNYINDIRIEHAKVLLKTTGKTVDEIAEITGFANSRTFRRNFHKATGITAMNYKST